MKKRDDVMVLYWELLCWVLIDIRMFFTIFL